MSVVQAWQDALAAEHRAVFGYGLLGARLTDTFQIGLARRCEAEHRTLRDRTSSAVRALAVEPVASLGDYPLPFPVVTAAAAGRLAAELEDGAALAWRLLIVAAGGASAAHAAGQAGLTASAVRAVRWRRIVRPSAPTVAFPGVGAP